MSEVTIFHEPEQLEAFAARRVDTLLSAALKWHGVGSLAVSVRQPTKAILAELATLRRDWSGVYVGQVDEVVESERAVGVTGSSSDWQAVRSQLLGSNTLTPERFLPMFEDSNQPVAEALIGYQHRLARALGSLFGFDVALMSLAADGGIGALNAGDVMLDSTKHFDVASNGEGPPRAGLTFASLQRCRTLLVIACGEGRAEHVHHLVELDGRVPAAQLRHSRIEIIADSAAASFLALT